MYQEQLLQNRDTLTTFEASTVEAAAQRYFADALAMSRMKQVFGTLFARSRRLLDLTTVQANYTIISQYDAGLQTVCLDWIRGSLNRADCFDVDFYPTQEHSRRRWVNVAKAALDGIDLASVKLILVGDTYFVVDGHHRVSVARAFRQPEIQAEVRVWEVA